MDFYLANPQALDGQPKRTIADYVEQCGILVPRRFISLAEARASGLHIIARSEHQQDYAGASGMLKSPELQYEEYAAVQSEEELKQMVLAKSYVQTHIKQYCLFTGLDEETFRQGVSFSFWERLEGFNRTIVADSAIPGRYHVMTRSLQKGNWFVNYALFEGGTVVNEFANPLTQELKAGLPALIGFYEQIRHLGRFNDNHCPIIEAQTLNGKNYFLQYHRSRNFEPAWFKLERALEDGEIKAHFVRGATQEGGMDCKVTVYYAQPAPGAKLEPQGEDGSWDIHYNPAFSELMVRQRKVQMIRAEHPVDLASQLRRFVSHHLQRSELFKPQVSVIQDVESLLGSDSLSTFRERAKGEQNSCMLLRIVSDGRRAYVKRLE